ncbi:thromboxane-A synthase isoform X2 [Protopterus annectens]|nr:thromboxane-A synthase isoform X2 [Protopterus annectens]
MPFVGNLFFFSKGFLDGHQKLLNEYGRLCGYYVGRQPVILTADPEMLKHILVKNFINFPNRMHVRMVTEPMSESILFLRNERWKHVRSMLTPAFSAAKIKEMAPLINKACDVLVKNLQAYAESGENFNICRCYGSFTMDVVASVAFGTQIDSQHNPEDAFVKNAKTFFEFNTFGLRMMLAIAFPFLIPVLRNMPSKKGAEMNSFFLQAVRKMIAFRDQQLPEERRRDFLQLMLDARNTSNSNIGVEHFDVVNKADESLPPIAISGEKTSNRTQKTLSENEILGQAFIFLVAGYETTSSTLAFTTYLLANNPKCQKKLLNEVDAFFLKYDVPDYSSVQELNYLDMVISEALRMYPPAFRFARQCLNDCHVNGQFVPAGTIVEVPVACLHHDKEYWTEPEKFIPERFLPEAKLQRHPFVYLPFGAGPRSCIGMRLAILEIKITLVRVLQKFEFETCPQTQIPLQLNSKATLGPKDGIFIKLVPRRAFYA